ncbi:hypothetical protein EMQ25_17620 [Arsenicitalea aurantiaca]|uniref:Yip1 domain-containing protein n=1 Tax=Arsenicitalea aurantiaca TaxID=1783274 RepID=A0A433X277_9HYPH|nr:hypothetical protein [Arsenicitalea aurantiaca]RUT28216.1 hypothetical protein EMQ25_17620 [Arsenicitalea aurantiaca]
MANNTTLLEELVAAGRGVAALAIGNRRAPEHFDFSQRGLVGSFIALLVITAFNAYLPAMLGMASEGFSVARSLVMVTLLYAFQLAFAAIVLRQLKRLDGLVPYIVADNWATFFITVFSAILAFAGMTGDVALVFIGILVIVVEINIARLVVTLSPLQIAMFLVAQLVGASVGLIVVGSMFPLPEMPAV